MLTVCTKGNKPKSGLPDRFTFSEVYQLLYGLNLFSRKSHLSRFNTFFMTANFALLSLYFSMQIVNLVYGFWSPLTLVPFFLNLFNLIVCAYLFLCRAQIRKLNHLFQQFSGKSIHRCSSSCCTLTQLFAHNYSGEEGSVVYAHECLFALFVLLCTGSHCYLMHHLHSNHLNYGSLRYATKEFGFSVSPFTLIVLDLFTVGYNSNYATFSYFAFVIACKRFLHCSRKLNMIANSALQAPSGKSTSSEPKLVRLFHWVRLYLHVKRKLQDTLGFLVFVFLVSMFIATTSIVILVCEVDTLSRYRVGFGVYYLLAFCVPLMVSVCLVDQCEHLHVRSHQTLNRFLLQLLVSETDSGESCSGRLMSAFNLLHYGMQQTCLTAWHLLPINRRLPLKYFNLNISFIVMVYNVVKPNLEAFYKSVVN
jgi:hypothetical protein